MKIAFLYPKGRLLRLKYLRNGLSPTEYFYGAIELEANGHKVILFDIDPNNSKSPLQIFVDLLFKMHLLPSRTKGPIIEEIIKIRKKLNEVDIIVATTLGISLATATLKTWGLIKPPIIGLFLGLLNYRHSWLRKKINGIVLRRISVQLFGEGELEGMKKTYNLSSDNILVNQFGVDLNFWYPKGESEDRKYILSVGNDLRRDYELLFNIASKIKYPFKIVTARNLGFNIPKNVEFIKGTWPDQDPIDIYLRELYQNAACVILPLKDSWQPSGQTVALQAMACATPVIISKTKGLWSRTIMRHKENVYLVPVGDADSLQKAIEIMVSDPKERIRIGNNGLETVKREGDIKAFASRLEHQCQRTLAVSNKRYFPVAI